MERGLPEDPAAAWFNMLDCLAFPPLKAEVSVVKIAAYHLHNSDRLIYWQRELEVRKSLKRGRSIFEHMKPM